MTAGPRTALLLKKRMRTAVLERMTAYKTTNKNKYILFLRHYLQRPTTSGEKPSALHDPTTLIVQQDGEDYNQRLHEDLHRGQY